MEYNCSLFYKFCYIYSMISLDYEDEKRINEEELFPIESESDMR
jgi:hypothetical protein